MADIRFSMVVSGEADYEAIKAALIRVAATSERQVEVGYAPVLGFDKEEHAFDIQLSIGEVSPTAIPDALVDFLSSLPRVPIEIIYGKIRWMWLGRDNHSEQFWRSVASRSLETERPSFGTSWAVRDIGIALVALFAFVLALTIGFSLNAGSLSGGLQKGWPILIIVAVASMPAALAAGLRWK